MHGSLASSLIGFNTVGVVMGSPVVTGSADLTLRLPEPILPGGGPPPGYDL